VSDLLDNLTSVEVMRLEPGDVIVASVDSRIDSESAARITDTLRTKFPDHDVLVLSRGVKISLTREDQT